jgi:hypothetical protein
MSLWLYYYCDQRFHGATVFDAEFDLEPRQQIGSLDFHLCPEVTRRRYAESFNRAVTRIYSPVLDKQHSWYEVEIT